MIKIMHMWTKERKNTTLDPMRSKISFMNTKLN